MCNHAHTDIQTKLFLHTLLCVSVYPWMYAAPPHYIVSIVAYYIVFPLPFYINYIMYICLCLCCLWYALCLKSFFFISGLPLQDNSPVVTSVSFLLKVHPKQEVSFFNFSDQPDYFIDAFIYKLLVFIFIISWWRGSKICLYQWNHHNCCIFFVWSFWLP